MIDKPGIYTDMAAATYFADPCPAPSLTQSVAKILLEKSPLHAWHAHPRLNPDYHHDDATKYDVGNIAHKLIIGRGKEIVVLEEFDDWRTKASKEARDAAASKGQLAVLGKHFVKADRMVKAAREQLTIRGLDLLFDAVIGAGEVVTAWQEGNFWCRQMIDWLKNDRLLFTDYKTTQESAAPHALARKMAADGWPIQAAMAERGLDVLDPKNAGRRRFLFVVQETDVPYALNVVEIGEGPMTMGRKMLSHAMDIWGTCIARNQFPGYPAEILEPEYPGWAETQWLNREIADSERQPSDLIMAG